MFVIMKNFAAARDRIRAVGLSWNEDGELLLSVDVEGRMISIKEAKPIETVRLYGHVVSTVNGLSKEEKQELVKACAEELGVLDG